MADPATPLPTSALAPAPQVLDPKALGQTASVLPGTILAQNVQTTPPAADTSVFDAVWFGDTLPGKDKVHEIFRAILQDHNDHLDRFTQWRDAILLTAEAEVAEIDAGKDPATNLLKTVATLLHEVYTKGPLPPGKTRPTKVDFTQHEIRDMLVSPLADGNFPRVYDPWAAWWAGIFTSGTYKAHNVHIWEPECSVVGSDGTIQSVQAVTQVETELSKQKLGIDKWFVSASRLLQNPACFQEANYAINVWSADHHLTGYVWKGLKNGSLVPVEKMPHIAFLLEPDTLLWLATNEFAGAVFNGKARVLNAFVEWGMPQSDFSGAYNIRGTYTAARAAKDSAPAVESGLEWKSGAVAFNPVFKQNVADYGHCGYRQCAQYPDKLSFLRAQSLGLLGKTDKVAIDSAIAI